MGWARVSIEVLLGTFKTYDEWNEFDFADKNRLCQFLRAFEDDKGGLSSGNKVALQGVLDC